MKGGKVHKRREHNLPMIHGSFWQQGKEKPILNCRWMKISLNVDISCFSKNIFQINAILVIFFDKKISFV